MYVAYQPGYCVTHCNNIIHRGQRIIAFNRSIAIAPPSDTAEFGGLIRTRLKKTKTTLSGSGSATFAALRFSLAPVISILRRHIQTQGSLRQFSQRADVLCTPTTGGIVELLDLLADL
jgi:hypothetical protein